MSYFEKRRKKLLKVLIMQLCYYEKCCGPLWGGPIKVDRDLIFSPNDRYSVVPLISIHLELLMRCPEQEIRVKVDPNCHFL